MTKSIPPLIRLVKTASSGSACVSSGRSSSSFSSRFRRRLTAVLQTTMIALGLLVVVAFYLWNKRHFDSLDPRD